MMHIPMILDPDVGVYEAGMNDAYIHDDTCIYDAYRHDACMYDAYTHVAYTYATYTLHINDA